MIKHTPINAPLLRKLQAFCCVPGALRLDKIEALLQASAEAGFIASSAEASSRFMAGEAPNVEVVLGGSDGRELGVLHLSAKSGAVTSLAFAQAVARVDSFAEAASEAAQVTRQLAYGVGNPTLAFDDASRVTQLTPDQVTEDVLVSLQSWFPRSNFSGRTATLKEYERLKAQVKGGLELRVAIAPVVDEGDPPTAAHGFDIVVLAMPVGQI